MQRSQVSSAVRFLCTHNPFYLISTLLVLYGIQDAFQEGLNANPWALAGTLIGFAVLLAVTAFWIVRAGGVWDDARSIMLILMLMFFAISISFDHTCANAPATAQRLLVLCLGFAVLISEGLLRGLRMKLPLGYRLPYYAILALMFMYPLALSPAAVEQSPLGITTRVLLFPFLAAGCFLLLIPAIRRGSKVVAKNGTPWSWPWYPWPIFVFLGFGVAVRTFVLNLSFLPAAGWSSGFDLYFLLPLWLALVLILLEIGIVERRERVSQLALLLAPGALPLALPWLSGAQHDQFLSIVAGTVGAPLWIALMVVIAVYAFAWLRQVRGAETGFVLALLPMTLVSPTAVRGFPVETLNWWPLALLAIVQLAFAIRRQQSVRAFAATFAGTAAVCVWADDHVSPVINAAIGYHIVLMSLLLVSGYFQDGLARVLQRATAYLLAIAAILAVLFTYSTPGYTTVVIPYSLGAAIIACYYWYQFRSRPHLYATVVSLASCGVAATTQLVSPVNHSLGPQATIPLLAGAAFFFVATLISAYKGGLLRRSLRDFRRFVASVEGEEPAPETI